MRTLMLYVKYIAVRLSKHVMVQEHRQATMGRWKRVATYSVPFHRKPGLSQAIEPLTGQFRQSGSQADDGGRWPLEVMVRPSDACKNRDRATGFGEGLKIHEEQGYFGAAPKGHVRRKCHYGLRGTFCWQ